MFFEKINLSYKIYIVKLYSYIVKVNGFWVFIVIKIIFFLDLIVLKKL